MWSSTGSPCPMLPENWGCMGPIPRSVLSGIMSSWWSASFFSVHRIPWTGPLMKRWRCWQNGAGCRKRSGMKSYGPARLPSLALQNDRPWWKSRWWAPDTSRPAGNRQKWKMNISKTRRRIGEMRRFLYGRISLSLLITGFCTGRKIQPLTGFMDYINVKYINS